MKRIATALLQFDPRRNTLAKAKELRHGLSVALQAERNLWLANDETVSLERLSPQGKAADGSLLFGEHRQFALNDFLALPRPPSADCEDIEEADIEGLAVIGRRVLLGLRGPVLRGWAIILELQPEAVEGDPGALTLRQIGPDQQPYLKHFLPLDGLGIRDLCRHGDDVLILTGPTMDLDGPVTVFRWRRGGPADADGLAHPEALSIVGSLPFGQGAEKGMDHAEGMCLFAADGLEAPALLVVYDSAAPRRLAQADFAVTADIFALV